MLTNPLPASWKASLENPGRAKDVAASVRDMPGPSRAPNGVKYGGRDADRLLRNAAVVEAVIGGLILVLAISAVALIANTIRLSIFARRREVEVMKLVGASNWFVRLPFVLEGMLCGLGGAVLSIALWASRSVLLKDHLPAASLNEDGAHAIAFWCSRRSCCWRGRCSARSGPAYHAPVLAGLNPHAVK